MKVVKNINNNVSLCLDSQGREVIAFGKGIGFAKPPKEIPLEKIDKTYYDVNLEHLELVSYIDENIIEISKDIVEFAQKKLDHMYSANIIFAIADHIQFAIQRQKKNICIRLPLLYEVQTLYPKEIKVGNFALSLIENELDVRLPKEEAACIALSLVDYGLKNKQNNEKRKSVIDKSTEIIEQVMKVKINKRGFEYSRFVTHMYYMLDRVENNKPISSDNQKIFSDLKKEYPEIYECAVKISRCSNLKLNNEELLYLILHINRLCVR